MTDVIPPPSPIADPIGDGGRLPGAGGGRTWRGPCLLALLLLAAALPARQALAQSADDAFLAALGEMREAGFPDKAAIVERLSSEVGARLRSG